MKEKRNEGITLIALIVTIIIMLILAGITIVQLTNSGLFENVKLSKEKYKESQELENSVLSNYIQKPDIESSREGGLTENQVRAIVTEEMNKKKVKLIEKGSTKLDITLKANEWTNVHSIDLKGNGTGVAIISFTITSENNNTVMFQNLIRKNYNGKLYDLASDAGNNNESLAWKRCCASTSTRYDENTIIELYGFSSTAFQPYTTYSITLIPD